METSSPYPTKRRVTRRSKRAVEIKSGPDVVCFEPFFVGCFWKRDSLADPRPGVSSGAVVSSLRKNEDLLLDVIQFRSQREKLCFTGDPAWMFGIESNAGQVLSNAQTHQVIACELLAGQAIAGCLIHLPGPGEIFVGNPFVAEVAVRNVSMI